MCRENDVILYFYEELSSIERENLERHMIVCEKCQNFLADLEEISSIDSQFSEIEVKEEVSAHIKLQTRQMMRQKRTVFWIRIAAMIIIVLFLSFGWRRTYQINHEISIAERQIKIENEKQKNVSWDRKLDEDIERIKKQIIALSSRNSKKSKTPTFQDSLKNLRRSLTSLKFKSFSFLEKSPKKNRKIQILRNRIAGLTRKIDQDFWR